MATFLVTGGAGYVGSHTAKALARSGHTCIAFDDLSTGHRDFVRWGPLITGDIRDASALDDAFRSHPIDGVIHFAARAYVAESVSCPGLYYDVNIRGTLTLLDAMLRAGVLNIVFSSTCAVYGVQGNEPITERCGAKPINPYGFSKLACEHLLQDYEAAHALRSMRLRYFNAAGADRECEIGEHHDPEPHLIPLVLEAAAGRRPAVHVFGTNYATPDGTAIRDYVHVEDLASAHIAAAERLLSGAPSMTLNLGSGVGSSVHEVIRTAESVTRRRIATACEQRRPGDPPALVADIARARRLLGWTPQRSDLATITADAWAWSIKRFGDAACEQARRTQA